VDGIKSQWYAHRLEEFSLDLHCVGNTLLNKHALPTYDSDPQLAPPKQMRRNLPILDGNLVLLNRFVLRADWMHYHRTTRLEALVLFSQCPLRCKDGKCQ
jgi:hypothetical protein